MTHNYYEEDYDGNNTQRLEYFDDWFDTLTSEVASARGITLSQYLSQIKNFTTFKAILKEAFSQDPSLSDYVSGMSQRSFRLFFERPKIRAIVEANLEEEPERIEEDIIPKPRPISVEQVKKETRTFFKAKFKEKDTGKIRRTIGYEDEFKIKGKKTTRLRDAKGRFVAKN